jgi:PAS domain S-box-containing protein
MTVDDLSQRVSELSQRLEELQVKCASNPANAPEILSDALKSLQASLEELSAADEELMQQNEGLIEAQSTLRMSEEKFQLVADFAYDWVVWLGTKGNYVYVSPSCERITGYKAGEFMKSPMLDLDIIHPDDRSVYEHHRDVHHNGQVGKRQIDFRIVTAKGETRWINHLCQPIFSKNGEWLGRRGSNRDITERKTAEEALKEAKDNLETHVKERTAELEQANARLQIEIAERKRSEEALRIAWSYNRSLIEASLDPLVTIGPDGKITDVNAATESVTGYRFEELVGTDFSGYFTDPDEANAGYQKVFRDGFVLDYPLEIQHRDGHKTPVLYNASVYRTDEGQVAGVFAAARDVTERRRAEIELDNYRRHLEDLVHERTHELEASNADLQAEIIERKKAEEALRLSEQKFITAFANNPAAIAITRLEDGQFLEVNDTFLSMMGYSRDELIGRSARKIPIWPTAEAAHRYVEELRENGFLKGWEQEFHKKSGELFIVQLSAQVLTIQGVEMSLSTLIDITERKRAEEELRKAHDELELRVKERTAELSDAKENLEVINEELLVEISAHEKTEKELIIAKEAAEAAVEAKSAFLMNMSHELRTPLNAVIGFSSLLLDDNLTQDQKEYIESIRNGGQALLALISDILEFSMAEKEKVKLELQPLRLKHCIEESMDMVAVQAEQKGLNLTYIISYGTQDTIIGDPGRLRQVIVNLLSNAVKFTDAGDISVSVSSKTIKGNKHQIQFAVKDTGIGMPQDKMDRLFQPFTQLEYTLSRKRDGAGLGLSICKKLVELMGGKIWAESEEGKGSTFKFTIQAETLPGKQLDLSENEKAAICENLSVQKPLSILVAEDNPSNQRVLVDMLKRLGYRADAVADGVEVLQALQIRPYDLVFMDIRMPEMDGLTATKEIRKLWPDNGPKVVAITAFAMDKDRETCLDAGMDGYIAKPVDIDDLVMLLHSITLPPKNKI